MNGKILLVHVSLSLPCKAEKAADKKKKITLSLQEWWAHTHVTTKQLSLLLHMQILANLERWFVFEIFFGAKPTQGNYKFEQLVVILTSISTTLGFI